MADPYRSGSSDTRWEYKVVALKIGFRGVDEEAYAAELNRLGAEGWELVAVTHVNGVFATLKRPKP